ncbi:MAG: hypothetical protein R3284_06970 [Rubricoccaceae bacterium]|nr:hypothetical protein [Rubricoccaceae bacterium]
MEALALLRKRVEAAIREIERLRNENEELRSRVAEMETHTKGSQTMLSLFSDEDSPEELRARIEGFIDTIDAILAPAESSETKTNGQEA